MAMKFMGNSPSLNCRQICAAAKIFEVNVEFPEFKFGEDNETPEWQMNVHPLQRCPGLDCGADGYLFESGAIYRHVLRAASKNGKNAYGRTAIEASQVDQWIEFAKNELNAHSMKVIYTKLGWGAFSQEEQDRAVENVNNALSGLEAWLETRTFLVGERLTGADLSICCAVELALQFCGPDMWKHKNVVRYYHTIFNASPAYATAMKDLCMGSGAPVAKPAAEPKPKAQAGGGAAAAKKPAEKKPDAAADDGSGEDDEPAPPKKQDPFALLPKSPMDLDAFKREYSNSKNMKNVVAYLKREFDAEGFQLWFGRYKHGDDIRGQQVFMTSNLVRGFFQRLEGQRKYCFGIALICGTDAEHNILAMFICRKHENDAENLPFLLADSDDAILYDWHKSSPLSGDTDDLIESYFEYEGTESGRQALGVACIEGRCFK